MKINEFSFRVLGEDEGIMDWGGSWFLWNPDGTKIAYTSNRRCLTDFDLWIVDVATKMHKMIKMTGGDSVERLLCWTEDNSLIFTTKDGKVKKFQLGSLTGKELTTTNDRMVWDSSTIAHVPQGFLVTQDDKNDVEIFDLVNSKVYRLPYLPPLKNGEFLGLTGDGQFVRWNGDDIVFTSFLSPEKKTNQVRIPSFDEPVTPYLLGDNRGSYVLGFAKPDQRMSVWLYKPAGT